MKGASREYLKKQQQKTKLKYRNVPWLKWFNLEMGNQVLTSFLKSLAKATETIQFFLKNWNNIILSNGYRGFST